MKKRRILLALGVAVTIVSFNKGITLGRVQRTQANTERRAGEVPLSNTHSQEQTVDAQTKDQLRVIITHLLDTLYVSPEIGKQLASQMQAKFESGAYKEITTPTKLAEVLTRDLRELSNDLHLRIRYAPSPVESATILTPQEWEQRRSSMFSMVPRGPSTPQASAAPAGPQGPQRTGRIDAGTANLLLESNYHFREVKYLSGNIGYLKLDGFAPGQAARDTAAKTMALLAHSEGVIIDMRRCPGGTQEMVNFLASYFFDKEPRLLLTSYFRPTGETVQNKTIADIPGKRMVDTDLYLLVSANTVSACEAFAYILQQYGRAKVIGERTAGAGNHNALIPIGLGYSFSVSIGSVVHPLTGKGWQGDGVQPDTVVKPDDALEAAHREALQKLISRTTDQNRKKGLLSVLQDVARSSDTPTAVASQLTRGEPGGPQAGHKMSEAEIIKETETYLEQAVAEDTFSGGALIAKDGKPIFEKAYGLANKSSNTPNNVDTKFNLGSINKSFTSVAIAQLAQQGKLSFNDPISKYLPDYPNKTVAAKVTIHQLLTHTSGMGSYFNDEFMKRRASLRTLADLLPLFVNDPLSFEPGEKMQYSNSGYVVLGLIIEKLTRQTYFDYVREHIFKTAGMKNTDSYELEQKVPNLAIGYTNMGLTGRPEPGPRKDSTPHLTGRGNSAGGGYSTLDDMLKFGQALIGHKLLNQQYTDIVLSNQMPLGQPPAGYGFFSVEVNGIRAIGNNGGGPGTNSTFTVYPELGYTVVIMSNYDPPSASKVTSKLREMLTAK